MTNDEMLSALQGVTLDVLGSLIKYSGSQGKFQSTLTLRLGDVDKPVLIVGTAHGLPHEDGDAIAVLNPDPDLVEGLHAGTGYSGAILKEIVSGKCDAMIHVWLDAYKKDGGSVIGKYVSRTMKDAKFEVR